MGYVTCLSLPQQHIKQRCHQEAKDNTTPWALVKGMMVMPHSGAAFRCSWRCKLDKRDVREVSVTRCAAHMKLVMWLCVRVCVCVCIVMSHGRVTCYSSWVNSSVVLTGRGGAVGYCDRRLSDCTRCCQPLVLSPSTPLSLVLSFLTPNSVSNSVYSFEWVINISVISCIEKSRKVLRELRSLNS